ncbi:DUF4352 domain-containing protein [Enterococcus sp. LJL120]
MPMKDGNKRPTKPAQPRKKRKRKKSQYSQKLLPFNLASGILAIFNSIFCFVYLIALFVSAILSSGAFLGFLTVCFTASLILHIIGLHYNSQYKLGFGGHICGIIASVMMIILPAFLFLPAFILYIISAAMNLKKVRYRLIPARRLTAFYKKPLVDVFIVVAVILGAIGVFGFNGAGDGDTEPTSSTTNSEGSSANSSQSSEGSSETATNETAADDSTDASTESSEAAAETIVPVFESYDGEEFRIAVTEIRMEREIRESDLLSYTADEGTKYLLVYLTVMNTSDSMGSFSTSDFRVIDEAGAQYSPTTLLGLSDNISFESMNPGIETRGFLAYTVPESLEITGLQLAYSGSSLFSSERVLFALS